jgi:hypothetical protein
VCVQVGKEQLRFDLDRSGLLLSAPTNLKLFGGAQLAILTL